MKKYLLLIAFVSTLISAANSQNLYNTTWSVYDPSNTFFSYFQFSTNTLSFSPDNITYTPVSNFVVNGSSFTIFDISGITGCALTDTGDYTFTISNDTLRFTLVSDPCSARSSVLSVYYGILFATGIQTQNKSAAISLSPNPSLSGIFNLKWDTSANEVEKITVTTLQGKLILDDTALPEHDIIDHVIDLSDFPSGIYLLTLQGKKFNKVIKLLK